MVNQKEAGLYDKFYVERRDDRDGPEGDRQNADYFVLDLTYDPFAPFALARYIEVCRHSYPQLAEELTEKLRAHMHPGTDEFSAKSKEEPTSL